VLCKFVIEFRVFGVERGDFLPEFINGYGLTFWRRFFASGWLLLPYSVSFV
jgi:hypothetical protein